MARGRGNCMHDCRIFQANADQLLDPGAIYCAVKHYIQQWCQMKLTFGPFELASRERALRRGGLVLPLGSRALDILICLVNRPGEVITKKELIDHVWPNVFVEEGVLRVHMASIRKVLGDGQ